MLKQNLPQLIKKKKEKALKTTNSVFGRLNKIGKLDEFQAKIDDMVKLGTMIQLTIYKRSKQLLIKHFCFNTFEGIKGLHIKDTKCW